MNRSIREGERVTDPLPNTYEYSKTYIYDIFGTEPPNDVMRMLIACLGNYDLVIYAHQQALYVSLM